MKQRPLHKRKKNTKLEIFSSDGCHSELSEQPVVQPVPENVRWGITTEQTANGLEASGAGGQLTFHMLRPAVMLPTDLVPDGEVAVLPLHLLQPRVPALLLPDPQRLHQLLQLVLLALQRRTRTERRQRR